MGKGTLRISPLCLNVLLSLAPYPKHSGGETLPKLKVAIAVHQVVCVCGCFLVVNAFRVFRPP